MSLAFLTDAARIPDPAPILAALPAGTGVVYRDYDTVGRIDQACRYADFCIERDLVFYVAGDVGLAERAGAHGVHLPARMATEAPEIPEGMLLSVSCHNAEEILGAEDLGADSLFLSPVFATASHPGAKTLGVEAFKALTAESSTPVLALGGVTEENAAQLKGPNVAGFGAIGAFDISQG